MFQNEQIYQLIPQRPPIVMVDTLWSATESGAETGLTIDESNIFVQNGVMREAGLIEHIAQSAAAYAGYSTFSQGLPPKLGFIGEIKSCKIHTLPAVGSQLRTEIKLMAEAAGVTLIAAETHVADTLVAECQMKIFIKED